MIFFFFKKEKQKRNSLNTFGHTKKPACFGKERELKLPPAFLAELCLSAMTQLLLESLQTHSVNEHPRFLRGQAEGSDLTMSTGQRREFGADEKDGLWGMTLRGRAGRDWGEGCRSREPRAGVHKSGARQQGLVANSLWKKNPSTQIVISKGKMLLKSG